MGRASQLHTRGRFAPWRGRDFRGQPEGIGGMGIQFWWRRRRRWKLETGAGSRQSYRLGIAFIPDANQPRENSATPTKRKFLNTSGLLCGIIGVVMKSSGFKG